MVISSALCVGDWSASFPSHFTPAPATRWIGVWVDPRCKFAYINSLYNVKKHKLAENKITQGMYTGKHYILLNVINHVDSVSWFCGVQTNEEQQETLQ